MKTHHLKTRPEYFEAVLNRDKKAELRLNDRDFQEGDTLVLEEYEPGGTTHFYDPSQDDGDGEETTEPHYTGRSLTCVVCHLLRGPEFGLQTGYVMMSLEIED